MFYVEQDDKIILFDESKARLVDTIKFMPEYHELEIKETNRPIIDFEFADTEEYQERKAAERQAAFEQEFFSTSLGWIRRVVTMADGSKKDFLSGLLPSIAMGLSMGQAVEVLAYNAPDFSKDVTDWTQYQHSEAVTQQFVQECFVQLSNDFKGE